MVFLAVPLPCLPLLLSLLSLVEDQVGGGLLAFLHRVLCARPGLGSGPYPLSTLSRFSDSHPSSSPLNTLPPSSTSSTPLGCFPNHSSCQQPCSLLNEPPTLCSLLLLSPSLALSHVSPIIHCPPSLPFPSPSLPFPSPFSISLPSMPVAAGPASVTQMHPVALGARHGNEALAGPSVTVCFGVCGCFCACVQHGREGEGEGEGDEREYRDGTHSRIPNLVSRVCLSLTFTWMKDVSSGCETVLCAVCLHTHSAQVR